MDIAWGLGPIFIALIGLFQDKISLPKILLSVMVTLWGLRLASYIFFRSIGQDEDSRYQALKDQWGENYLRQGYLKIFMFQGFLMFITSLPIQLGMKTLEVEFTFFNVIGFMLWGVGFSLESYADYYLKKFKSNPLNKGKLCLTGPWKICRFPNYLGEISLWWGIYLYTFDLSTCWSVLGTMTLTFFILKVSGIPLTEEKYLKRPEYREYAKKVPRLIPLIGARYF